MKRLRHLGCRPAPKVCSMRLWLGVALTEMGNMGRFTLNSQRCRHHRHCRPFASQPSAPAVQRLHLVRLPSPNRPATDTLQAAEVP